MSWLMGEHDGKPVSKGALAGLKMCCPLTAEQAQTRRDGTVVMGADMVKFLSSDSRHF